jgi:large subunit ribosomal protein L4
MEKTKKATKKAEPKVQKKVSQKTAVVSKAKVLEPKKAVSKVKKTENKNLEVKVALSKNKKNLSGIHKVNPRKEASEKKPATSNLKVEVMGVDGVSRGNINLPIEIFGQTPNKTLIAQAVRVYLANQRQGNASTKTRSEVKGSAKKVYRQKGTGRARHGAITGPIFVGGGIVFGPHPHDFSLKFPKKMRQAALISALSEKAIKGDIKVIDGDFSGKTKEVSKLMKSLNLVSKNEANKVLFVIDKNENAFRGAQNIAGLTLENAQTITTYNVVASRNVVFLKNAIEDLSLRYKKGN